MVENIARGPGERSVYVECPVAFITVMLIGRGGERANYCITLLPSPFKTRDQSNAVPR